MQGDILEDIALIENLEETKRTSVEIAAQVKAAKDTEVRPALCLPAFPSMVSSDSNARYCTSLDSRTEPSLCQCNPGALGHPPTRHCIQCASSARHALASCTADKQCP